MNYRVTFWTRLQSFGFAFFLIVMGCGVTLLFIPLIKRHQTLRQEVLSLDAEIATQTQIEKRQRQEIDALKTDPVFVEKVAREKLNLVGPGEIIFRFEPNRHDSQIRH